LIPIRHKRVSHGKEIYYIVSIVVVVAATLFSILSPGGYLEMKKVQADLEARRDRVEVLRRENQAKMESIQALRSSREALEKYARGKGYAKKNELIQQLPPEKVTSDK
jgi:cell division protein FtsB